MNIYSSLNTFTFNSSEIKAFFANSYGLKFGDSFRDVAPISSCVIIRKSTNPNYHKGKVLRDREIESLKRDFPDTFKDLNFSELIKPHHDLMDFNNSLYRTYPVVNAKRYKITDYTLTNEIEPYYWNSENAIKQTYGDYATETYKELHKAYIQFIGELTNDFSTNSLIIDMGCGDGRFLRMLSEKSKSTMRLIGLDQSLAVKNARKTVDIKSNISFFECDIIQQLIKLRESDELKICLLSGVLTDKVIAKPGEVIKVIQNAARNCNHIILGGLEFSTANLRALKKMGFEISFGNKFLIHFEYKPEKQLQSRIDKYNLNGVYDLEMSCNPSIELKKLLENTNDMVRPSQLTVDLSFSMLDSHTISILRDINKYLPIRVIFWSYDSEKAHNLYRECWQEFDLDVRHCTRSDQLISKKIFSYLNPLAPKLFNGLEYKSSFTNSTDNQKLTRAMELDPLNEEAFRIILKSHGIEKKETPATYTLSSAESVLRQQEAKIDSGNYSCFYDLEHKYRFGHPAIIGGYHVSYYGKSPKKLVNLYELINNSNVQIGFNFSQAFKNRVEGVLWSYYREILNEKGQVRPVSDADELVRYEELLEIMIRYNDSEKFEAVIEPIKNEIKSFNDDSSISEYSGSDSNEDLYFTSLSLNSAVG
ncbi:class I SAM-dependent methyltransferase [Endozoicomonas atrinae]|uniref:class I SAM-dependent methyltransferase n=1 Tax=Endozoicomonas atrinae TaxID=1333660 RepID=UPI000825E7F3|nr:class I SAM-dependent methyltransferase [Endozoicomonas atrinae]